MSTYVFGSADHSIAIKDGASWIPWDSARGRPASHGFSFDEWVTAGSPKPDAYKAPPLAPADVDAFVAARLRAGYADVATEKTWQCDDVSLIKWAAIGASAGLAIAMNVTPLPTFTLIAADNTTVTLTAAQAFDLFNARMMSWVSATVLHARTMKNNILAGNPPTDITAGWP